MKSALPLRPVEALTASVQLFQVCPSQGSGGRRSKAARTKSASSDDSSAGTCGPSRTMRHQSAASSARSRLPRTASHKRFGLRAGHAQLRQPLRHCRIGLVVDQLAAQHLQLGRVELGGRLRCRGRVEQCRQRVHVRHGDDGFRGADQHGERCDRHRLDARLAQAAKGKSARALRQALAASGRQQIVVAKGRRLGAERPKQRDLRACVRHMVVAANDVADAHLDVVYNGGQRVEIGAVFAHQHRIRQGGQIDGLRTAHDVVPVDFGALRLHRVVGEVRQEEAPVRSAARSLQFRSFGICQLQCLAAINRRQATRQAKATAPLQLLGCFVAGIEQPRPLQPLHCCVVERDAPGLILDRVGRDAEPGEVLQCCIGIFLPRACHVGIVEALHEAAAVLQRKQPVEQSSARVADVQIAGRRRREADGDWHWRVSPGRGSGS
jgi:hypothetical protein